MNRRECTAKGGKHFTAGGVNACPVHSPVVLAAAGRIPVSAPSLRPQVTDRVEMRVVTEQVGHFEKTFTYTADGVLHSVDDEPSEVVMLEGEVYSKRWHKNGELHRDGDLPAELVFDDRGGELSDEVYWRDGKRHRDGDKPAEIGYYKDGSTNNRYWRDGKRHRDGDKPARDWVSKKGVPKERSWYVNGKLHRDGDEPAHIKFGRGGVVESQTWHQNGAKHRDGDKPAMILFHPDGITVKAEQYYKRNKVHRDGGKPAQVWYFMSGPLHSEGYFVDGRHERAGGPTHVAYREDGLVVAEDYRNAVGMFHREEGPASIAYFSDGSVNEKQTEYHWDGVPLPRSLHFEKYLAHRFGDLLDARNTAAIEMIGRSHESHTGAEHPPVTRADVEFAIEVCPNPLS